MPVLVFPNPDVLRLVLAKNLVPRGVTNQPARAVSDPRGGFWIELDHSLPRELVPTLARLGVQSVGASGIAGCAIGCWAELLPLKEAAAPPGPVLLELPESLLVHAVEMCRRLKRAPIHFYLLEESEGRAALHCETVPSPLLLEAAEPNSPLEAFVEQAPNVWVRRGWIHPLPDHLNADSSRVLFLRPPRTVEVRLSPPPAPAWQEFALPAQPRLRTNRQSGNPPRVLVHFRLQSCSSTPRELAWVFHGDTALRFREFCAGANERVIRQFEVAHARFGGVSCAIVRPAAGLRIPPFLPLAVDGFYPDPRLPSLYVPSRHRLQPALRPRELAAQFELSAERFTWVEPGPRGEAICFAVPNTAFVPVASLMEYCVPDEERLTVDGPPPEPFALKRYATIQAVEERPVEPIEPVTVDRPRTPKPGRFRSIAERHGWFPRLVDRLLSPFRRATSEADIREEPALPVNRSNRPSPMRRVDEKLASPAALVHGQDRAAKRHYLESQLLGDFPRLDPQRRSAGWSELAELYSATGNPADAAICWINATWDTATPSPAWLEQWVLAECRAARQTAPVPSLDRWLSEPGRFGAGRIVAAYSVWGAHQASPPADLVDALPRVMTFLDQHFDDLPARSAWLARLAVTQLCSGDALGLARWRDRILARLRDKGPGLDLDEPSFLRFHGTASPDRFQIAREWLVRSEKPILEWVGNLNSQGRLQWAGIDAETECTAAYARMLLAWGLGCLGERTRSRDWTARARKVLGRAAGPGLDPAVHAILSDAFQSRIRDVQEGRISKSGLPPELRARVEQLTDVHLGRYAVDKLRRHLRILEPIGFNRDYGGLNLRAFRGYDLLGERLQLLADRSDPAIVVDEAKPILAQCRAAPSSSNIPRVALTLLDLAPLLDVAQVRSVLELAEPAASWMEAWFDALSWGDANTSTKLPQYLMRLLHSALSAAAWCNEWPAVRPLVEFLVRRSGSDPALRSAIMLATGPLFRSLRKLGYRNEAEALLHRLDPGRGEWPADTPTLPPSQFGLAVGWFAIGDEEAGNRILDDARNRLFVFRTGDDRDRTELAIAYAEALGFAPPRIALGRLEEIFQLLESVIATGSTNRYFTLKPLQLIDAVVRSVVTEDFALGPAVRGWLDDDEFLIRRRIHRDMAAVLRDSGMS